jgi:hypothetical protein
MRAFWTPCLMDLYKCLKTKVVVSRIGLAEAEMGLRCSSAIASPFDFKRVMPRFDHWKTIIGVVFLLDPRSAWGLDGPNFRVLRLTISIFGKEMGVMKS